jgi:hypothetical protein
MSKPVSPEYVELKSFLRTFLAQAKVGGLSPQSRAIARLEEMEQTTPARAFSGLRMAINDCIEMSAHWPAEMVSALDAELKSQSILTLSQVRQRYWSKYRSLLRRGRIRDDVEYYIVQAVLSDQAPRMVDAERRKLEAMVAAYEQAAL